MLRGHCLAGAADGSRYLFSGHTLQASSTMVVIRQWQMSWCLGGCHIVSLDLSHCLAGILCPTDTRTPFYISVFAIGLNIILAISFVIGTRLGIYGLAWAQAIVAMLEVCTLFAIISRRIPKLFDRGHFIGGASSHAHGLSGDGCCDVYGGEGI